MTVLANRVRVTTATTGTGTITLGSAFSDAFCTFAEAGVNDGETVSYCIEEGDDFEIGVGDYTASGTTLSRDTVRLSKIGGTSGTSKMDLGGAATVRIVAVKEDLYYVGSDSDLDIWAGLTPSANAQSLVAAADYAAMRTLLDLEAGTDFYSISAADAAFQPIDAFLTDIAALTDPGADRLMFWDDSDGDVEFLEVGELTAEASPATGDKFLAYTAEGALVGVDFDNMPSTNALTESVGISVNASEGAPLSTGTKGYVRVPYTGTITAWTLNADQSGSIVVDVWKDTHANYPPTDADSITDGNEPELSSAVLAEDTDLGNWSSVAVTAGDWLGFSVDSVSGIAAFTLNLTIVKANS